MGKLRLSVQADVGKVYAGYLRKYVRRAHAHLSPALEELSIALVGDRHMADLHMQFMNIPGPTDVLTFPLEEDVQGLCISGEVILCVPEARRRAKAESTPLRNELLLYAIHGLLHLCGFDDKTARGFQRMHRTEDQILTALGVGPVFQQAERAAFLSPPPVLRGRARVGVRQNARNATPTPTLPRSTGGGSKNKKILSRRKVH